MRHFGALLVPLVAIGILCATPSFAETPRNTDASYVYLGHVDETGAWAVQRFDALPLVTISAELPATVQIVAREGMRLRADHSPSATEIGRLRTGVSVRLRGVYVSYGYVWGRVLIDDSTATLERTRQETGFGDGPVVIHVTLRRATTNPSSLNSANAIPQTPLRC